MTFCMELEVESQTFFPPIPMQVSFLRLVEHPGHLYHRERSRRFSMSVNSTLSR